MRRRSTREGTAVPHHLPLARRWLRGLGALVLLIGASGAAALGAASVSRPTTFPDHHVVAPRLAGAPPPHLRRGGSSIESRVTGDGRVRVTQWLRPTLPLTSVVLHRPGTPKGSRGTRLEHLEVFTDAGPVAASGRRDDGADTFRFEEPARLVKLRYSMAGTIDRSPSLPGRALLRTGAPPILGHTVRKGPVVVTVLAPRVLTMACVRPGRQDAAPRPCGAPVAGGWRVTLRGGDRHDSVQAQIDLAR